MNDLDKRVQCDTCIHTSKKGCMLFKTSADVWNGCLAGGDNVIIPKGWIKPMAYAYTLWQADKDKEILPDDLFEI